jgi:hypothetical protein
MADWSKHLSKGIGSGRINDALEEATRKLNSVRPRAASWVGIGKLMQVRADSEDGLIRVSFSTLTMQALQGMTDDAILANFAGYLRHGEEQLYEKVVMEVLKSFTSVIELVRETGEIIHKGYGGSAQIETLLGPYAMLQDSRHSSHGPIRVMREASRSASLRLLRAAILEMSKDGSSVRKESLSQAAAIRRHRNALKKVIGPAIHDGFPEEEITKLIHEAIVEATLKG